MAASKEVTLDGLLNETPDTAQSATKEVFLEAKSLNMSADPLSSGSIEKPLELSGPVVQRSLEPTQKKLPPVVKTGIESVDEAILNNKKEANGSNKEAQKTEQKTKANSDEKNKSIRSLKDRQKAISDSKDGTTDFKIILATLKAYSPLISAATYSPGQEGDGGDMGKAVSVMVNKTAEMTDLLCEMSNIDPKDPASQWKVSQLRGIAAQNISDQWKAFVSSGQGDFKLKGVIDAFSAANSAAKSTPDSFNFPEMSETLRLQVSSMKSIMPVLQEFNAIEKYMSTMFNGFKINKKVFQTVADEVFNESMILVSGLHTSPGDQVAKLVAFQSTLNHAGVIYAHAISGAFNQLVNKVKVMNKKDAQKYLYDLAKGNNSLINMDLVNSEFKRDFTYLSQIANETTLKYAKSTTFVEKAKNVSGVK